jgi:hypothetical protein
MITTSNENVLLVVCRYNEDVSWLKKIEIPYLIYDKSTKIYDSLNTKQIPNIGYEEFAYLSFIVENYHKLPNRTIFCQATSTDHNPEFLKSISNLSIKEYSDVQPLSSYWSPDSPGMILTSITDQILKINNCNIHIDFFDGNNARFNIEINKFERYPKEQQKVLYDILSSFLKKKDIRKGMADFINLPLRNFNNLEMTPMCYAALFSVTKERILKHPKEYYEYLLSLDVSLSKNNIYPKNKIFGWIMEYLWLELFEYEPFIETYNYEIYQNQKPKRNLNCLYRLHKTIRNKDKTKTKVYECYFCKRLASELEVQTFAGNDNFICSKKF